jgi:hypothetical protein
MFARYDLCSAAVFKLRWELFRINGVDIGSQWDRSRWNTELTAVVMSARPGLDEQKVRAMIESLWDCEG